jgi:ABC-type multidrug transport system fused ATPase/permease subunit
MQNHLSNIRSFFRSIFFLVSVALKNNFSSVLHSLLAMGVGSILQVLSAILLSSLIAEDSVRLLDEILPIWAVDQFRMLSVFSKLMVITCAYFVSTLMNYFGERILLGSSKNLTQSLTEIALEKLQRVEVLQKLNNRQYTPGDLTSLFNAGSIFAGRAFRLSMKSVQPILVSVVLVVLLFILEPAVTSIVIVHFVVLLVAQYFLNLRAARITERYANHSTAATLDVGSLLESAIDNFGTDDNMPDLSDSSGWQRYHKLFYRRLQILEDSRLVGGIIKAILIIVVSSYFFARVDLMEPTEVSVLISFVVILVVFLLTVQTVFSNINSISIIYPRLHELLEFIATDRASTKNAMVENGIFLSYFDGDSAMSSKLNPGCSIYIYSKSGINVRTRLIVLSKLVTGFREHSATKIIFRCFKADNSEYDPDGINIYFLEYQQRNKSGTNLVFEADAITFRLLKTTH